ncbi:hypothetical protein N7462_006426 [Penicillium macrosclerotiorum]|uniref:uncharacterized protein n=1 Tax=Penicillium macrosclerotiorum TaxID=303699 RepID=UPI002549AC1D|nr:uncharacterized protein N7462_006426 [Penicillium macrosclerotiorum]KAJ5683261.1 hypothetical protein N7462_006426 [Penicillium macrosclerotiorum]
MKFVPWLAAGLLACLTPLVGAEDLLQSHALEQCSDSTVITINEFSAVFTPSNNSARVSFDGTATYSGKVMIDVTLLVYGYNVTTKTIDPCDLDVDALCPIKPTTLKVPNVNLDVPSSTLSMIPGIAYGIPDLDAVVRLNIKAKDTGAKITCVEARVNNGKTVDQMGVSWALAILTGLGIFATIIVSLLGHSNIATHISSRTLLFLGFMQSQALYGMAGIEQRPIVQSWTQVFQWTMGLVHADFLETICTWFQRATGGTTSTVLTTDDEYSVIVQKRSVNLASIMARATESSSSGGERSVRGIERVGFRINIESTNIFMTGYLFYYFVTVVFILLVVALKFCMPALAKKVKSSKMERVMVTSSDWKDFIRGSLYRLASLGYPQMCALAMWELTHRDSAAEIVLAICIWLTMTVLIAWAMFKVFQRAQVSRSLRQHPAYTLFSDATCLTRWGFLYMNYKAHTYYFMVPLYVYTVAKGMTIAFGQSNPVPQAIVLLILEAAMLAATAIIRPFNHALMNVLAIIAAVLNFLNSIMFLVFSNVFNQADIVSGVMSLLFFFFNAIFTLVLLIVLLIGFYYVFALKEPTGKYQRLTDNRESMHMAEDRRRSELMPLEKNLQTTDGHLGSSGNIWQPASIRSRDTIEIPSRQSLQPTLPNVSSSSSSSLSTTRRAEGQAI